jgi:hypothetical protein
MLLWIVGIIYLMKINRLNTLMLGIVLVVLGMIFHYMPPHVFVDDYILCAGITLVLLHFITED